MKKYITGFFMAWGCFTVIPCPYKKWDENARDQMLFALPFIGLIVGWLWYGVYLLLWKALAIPHLITAVILAFFPMLLTGFIHIDGFMDCCDAIGSRRPREDKLRILKDSHVGAFACIGIAFWAMIGTGAMDAVLLAPDVTEAGSVGFLTIGKVNMTPCLILIPAVSRFMSAISVWNYPPLPTSQYNRTSGADAGGRKPVGATVLVMLLIFAIFFAVVEFSTFTHLISRTELVFVIEMVAYYLACMHARRQLGGMSGDISGYSITVAETAALLAVALL